MKQEENNSAEEAIHDNPELNIWEALIPVVALVAMLYFNVGQAFGDDAIDGSNQFVLLMGAAVAMVVGFYNKVSYQKMMDTVADNIKSTSGAILILLMVGALSGTWMISGIIPTMIYYGLQILNPTVFLSACVIICAIISLATGSSWTTSATVGIALIGIAGPMGISPGMTAGAVLSGAYFGDKMSPLSDTTNLAPAMAGTDLFTHIRYMAYTTVPSILVTLFVFTVLGFTMRSNAAADVSATLQAIEESCHISLWLFLVPLAVIGLIIKKTPPLVALFVGTLLAAVAALVFQPDLVQGAGGGEGKSSAVNAYMGVMNAITRDIALPTPDEDLAELFSSGGMKGMLGTIWLILCAMVFGGIMEAIGALSRISSALLSLSKSIFGLFASTVSSCLVLNFTASDQYLAIVVPGKMFSKAYRDKGLAPENLSRTLEDSATVTSVLIPWNTCGAYQSGVLGVSVAEYFIYAIFNWISPFTTLLYAALGLKIRQLAGKETPAA